MSTSTPRLQRSVLAATLAVGAAFSLLLAAPAAPPLAHPARAAEPTAKPLGPCVITATRRVEPLVARLGEMVDVTLEPSAVQPEPVAVSQMPRTLTWRYLHIPKYGVTMTYRVRVDAAGALTLPLHGRGTFGDSKNRVGWFDVPGVSVDVRP
ncbi:MAG: hypothetical protein ABI780_04620 [Ardenticatenales bacterium]